MTNAELIKQIQRQYQTATTPNPIKLTSYSETYKNKSIDQIYYRDHPKYFKPDDLVLYCPSHLKVNRPPRVDDCGVEIGVVRSVNNTYVLVAFLTDNYQILTKQHSLSVKACLPTNLYMDQDMFQLRPEYTELQPKVKRRLIDL